MAKIETKQHTIAEKEGKFYTVHRDMPVEYEYETNEKGEKVKKLDKETGKPILKSGGMSGKILMHQTESQMNASLKAGNFNSIDEYMMARNEKLASDREEEIKEKYREELRKEIEAELYSQKDQLKEELKNELKAELMAKKKSSSAKRVEEKKEESAEQADK